MIFQGFSVARNCSAPLTIMDIKRGFLCNFIKNFRCRHCMGYSGTHFQLLWNSPSSKPFTIVFKRMFKIPILDLKQRGYFSNFALIPKF